MKKLSIQENVPIAKNLRKMTSFCYFRRGEDERSSNQTAKPSLRKRSKPLGNIPERNACARVAQA